MLDRRTLLAGLSGSAALVVVGCNNARPASKAGANTAQNSIAKVGLQTYTLREAFKTSPMAAFEMIKKAGYDYVELNSRNFEQVPPQALKDMLDKIGLPSPASHISLEMIKQPLGPLMEIAKTLEIKYLTVPYIEEGQRRLEDWTSHAAALSEAGRVLRDNGFNLAYHNHQFEFDDLGGGTTAMDILLNDVPPEHLDFQIDLFWASLTDLDILEFLKQHPGRFKLCHAKDMGPNKADFANADYDTISRDLMKNVGAGVIDFERIFALNDISGMEYFIAEHDMPSKPYSAAIKASYNGMKALRF